MKAVAQSIEFTKQFIAINSYEASGKLALIDLVKQILSEHTPAEIWVDNSVEPALVATLKGRESQYCLMLEGHLDVVNANADMFKPILKEGVLYGRGSVDMKSGCAAILSAFIAASQHPYKRHDLVLVFTTDEETTGATIKHLLTSGKLVKPNFALIPEPTNLQICNAHKGETWLTVEFFGQAAHSSMPNLGRNAIYMASDFIQMLRKNTLAFHPQYGKETLSVGTIEGGSSPNVVPDYAKIRIDKRYLPYQKVEDSIAEIEQALLACKAQDSNFEGKLTIEGDWSALYTDSNLPDFKRIEQVISKTLEQETELIFWTAWGEGGYINEFGVPTIYFGPGETQLAHSVQEAIRIEDIEKATQAYIEIIKAFCNEAMPIS